MRILITTGIFPPDIGGPATQLDALIKEILAREPSFKITVLTFGEKGANYPYEVIKISKNNPKIFKSFFYFAKAFFLSLQNDTIYAWDLYTAGFSSYLVKKILFRKKLIIRFVGDSAWEYYIVKSQNPEPYNIFDFENQKYGFKIEFRKWLRKKILMSADTVVVPSEFIKKIAVEIGVAENKIKIIYNSVDFLFDEKERRELENINKNFREKELNFKEKGIYLVSISRLVKWKGQECLIEIMPDLIKKYGSVFLFIIGEGPEFENLKIKTSNFKLEDNVFLTGKLEHKNVFKYLKCADVFILNTAYEGLSHTLLEVMKVGVPIIASNVCSNPELIENGKNGFLTEYNNKKEIIDAVCKIIENPELKQKFARESKKRLEDFNFENLVKKTMDVLSCVNVNKKI